ncbi:MAG: DUF1707 domain-containing protein [Antricoccus sp.]
MTMSGSDDQTRVGNPERERAIGLLNSALTEGYLDIHEFDERAAVVYSARTRGDLRDVLAHLPGDDRPFSDRLFPAESAARVDAPPIELNLSWTSVSRKGSWQVPSRILVSGSMGTAELDFSHAQFSYGEVAVELQVSSSTVKVLLAEHQSIATDDLVCSSWSAIKDRTGAPTVTTGPTVRLHGALTRWSKAVIRRV